MSDSEWFAKYKFLQPIGQGGMGTVFLAEDKTQANATRVIKQMIHKPGDEFEKSESVRLFKREAEILRTLDHAGIVKIHDSHVSEDGKYFLVMDYIPGRNLEMIVNAKGGALTSEEVVRIAIHCCEVLEYLHTRSEPIIYRDLKPSNLMLTPDGEIIFIDFGIARLMPKEAATRVVTAGYSPPEQYFGRPETRSDIYSLGATMHHLLTGVRPKPLTACNPSAVNPSVSPRLNELVRRMTAHEVNDRPPNAQAVKFALYKIYQEWHPEFEIPEWMEKEWDERAQLEESARLKYGRTAEPAAQPAWRSGEQNAMRSGERNAIPRGTSSSQHRTISSPSSGQRPGVGRMPSNGKTQSEPHGPAENEPLLTTFVHRVKRWFETTLKR